MQPFSPCFEPEPAESEELADLTPQKYELFCNQTEADVLLHFAHHKSKVLFNMLLYTHYHRES